jgi:hypothetical protein
VNGPEEATELEHDANERMIEGLLVRLRDVQSFGREPCRAVLGTVLPGKLDVLLLDRASLGARVPRKEGVGLARKIGADVALALHAQGRVASRFIFSTDADATLPRTHFDLGDVEHRSDVAAAVFSFWHEASADPDVTRATALYELSLRYYVAGLAWAGSPYAFHTLGSALAVTTEAYAAVRGFPKRDAAEDFYLLNKVAKIGAIAKCSSERIGIESRLSARTPFGTGASVARAIPAERSFYAPDAFAVLRRVNESLGRLADHGSVDALYRELATAPLGVSAVVAGVLDHFDARTALARVCRETTSPAARHERIFGWFDAFRTLKLVHAARDRLYPSEPWKTAIERAPFAVRSSSGSGDLLADVRAAFARDEERRERFTGPRRAATSAR